MFTDKALRPFLLAILVIAAFILGAFFGNRSDDLGDVAQDLIGGDDAELTSEALDVIEESYFEEVDAEELENASVRAMVDELKRRYKDRFSHYFGPNAYERFKEADRGAVLGRRDERHRRQARPARGPGLRRVPGEARPGSAKATSSPRSRASRSRARTPTWRPPRSRARPGPR